jgi:DNA-binding NarL/FixJ family response regulator
VRVTCVREVARGQVVLTLVIPRILGACARLPDEREPRRPIAAQLAELVPEIAPDGLSNLEIGARIFISPRSVEYHLRKVFAKLGIASRTPSAVHVVPDVADLVTRSRCRPRSSAPRRHDFAGESKQKPK